MECHVVAFAKIENAIRHVEELGVRTFPHRASNAALSMLKERLQSTAEDLKACREGNPLIARAAARQANVVLDEILTSLGLLVNSSSTATPLEIHGPLSRIVQKVLGPEHNLIFSFTWEFSPFLYMPDTIKNNFVIISMPASEAENALIIPVSAHEIGHSIFGCCKKDIEQYIAEETADLGSSEPNNVDIWALYQCEEIFSDAIGVYIFGKSYFNALTYLLAPHIGRGCRDPEYPSLRDRVQYIYAAADCAGITSVPVGLVDLFDEETALPYNKGQVDLADQIVQKIAPKVIDKAITHCRCCGVRTPSKQEMPIVEAFKDGRPACNVEHVGDILNAGWIVYDDVESEKCFHKMEYVSELVLKTFEVMEIEEINKGKGSDI